MFRRSVVSLFNIPLGSGAWCCFVADRKRRRSWYAVGLRACMLVCLCACGDGSGVAVLLGLTGMVVVG